MRERLSAAADTEALGAKLARTRPPAGAPLATVHLRGELGSGKTTLAQGFLRACGIAGPVRSPTYPLIQLYTLAAQTLVHVDLYRLRTGEELDSLGLSEWALPGCLWLIEWPERAADRLPAADILVVLSVSDAAHEAQVTAPTAAGRAWLARLGRLERTGSS